MLQTLDVKIPVPAEYVLVKQSEYDELKTKQATGRMLNMSQLRECLGNKSVVWIKENILFNPRYADEMRSMEKNGSIVRPKGKGSPWLFQATVFTNWLEAHLNELEW